MNGEFRFFLALALLGGWLALETSTAVARLLKGKNAWLLAKNNRFMLLAGSMAFVVIEVYAFFQDWIWHRLRLPLEMCLLQWKVSYGVWEVAVFFRPWYAGYFMAIVLWGIYKGLGNYPVTLWFRLVHQRLTRTSILFIGASLGMVAAALGHLVWLFRLLSGPWMVLLFFFTWRGVMAVAYSSVLRGIPRVFIIAVFLVLFIGLGENFLTLIWVMMGVGLVSDWMVRKKETR
ncbi:hypothetical protein [Thermospira aquatica]|uniref:Uncharacterized protein n=1 Tax=Thermospira aquatica TaxID=2828656 RepID=A0AAX3BEJ9_9SPIR|nr:hypothetical protein [Thermospira aquatica]URA10767.1 hypothetical protein KDW03_02900 [Thermospira aquatica]